MTDTAAPSLLKAKMQGLSEVTLARTLARYNEHMNTGNDRPLNFRGDVAEDYHYDKVVPLLKPAMTHGNMVYIEAQSQKNGTTGFYQILVNQWNLLEVLAKLD